MIRNDPPEGIDRIVSCAEHEGVARDLLVAFKFRHLTELATLIAGFMADAVGLNEAGSLLVPVPPARLRTWVRGFDPVASLGEEVAAQAGIESPEAGVLRRRGSGRQRGRGRAGRIGDPPDICATKDAGQVVGGRPVLLLDDVVTTGATLAAAASAIRQVGAGPVAAVTFTRRS